MHTEPGNDCKHETHPCRPKVASSNALAAFFANCPDNAFQKVPAGMEPFSMVQRGKAILRNGGKLLGVGFCASMLGTIQKLK